MNNALTDVEHTRESGASSVRAIGLICGPNLRTDKMAPSDIAWTGDGSTEQSGRVTARVRRLRPEDHELIRTIRLRSLTLEPTAFGSTFEHEAAFIEDDWRERLAPDASPHFVTIDDSGAPTGMVVGARDA